MTHSYGPQYISIGQCWSRTLLELSHPKSEEAEVPPTHFHRALVECCSLGYKFPSIPICPCPSELLQPEKTLEQSCRTCLWKPGVSSRTSHVGYVGRVPIAPATLPYRNLMCHHDTPTSRLQTKQPNVPLHTLLIKCVSCPLSFRVAFSNYTPVGHCPLS